MILPDSIRAVLLHLDDAVNRCEAVVAEIQQALNLRFSHDIEAARQFRLQDAA